MLTAHLTFYFILFFSCHVKKFTCIIRYNNATTEHFSLSVGFFFLFFFLFQKGATWNKTLSAFEVDDVTLDPEDCIVAMEYLMEKEALLLGSSNGCLILHNADDKATEVVGRVEGGVTSITCSPDGALISLTTGLGQLLVMTQDWEVLYETALIPHSDVCCTFFKPFVLKLFSLF